MVHWVNRGDKKQHNSSDAISAWSMVQPARISILVPPGIQIELFPKDRHGSRSKMRLTHEYQM